MAAPRSAESVASRAISADRAERDENVPLQVMVSPSIKRQIAHLCAERGESLRTLVLRALRAHGIDVPDEELFDRRGRRRV